MKKNDMLIKPEIAMNVAIIIGMLIIIILGGKVMQKHTNHPVTGSITGKPQWIGAVTINNGFVEHWFSIPVDTDGDGKKDILVLDTAQDTTGFASGMEVGWKVTFKAKDGLEIGKFLPFLWGPVLDPNLPINTPQPVYISNGVYSTE